MKCPGWPKTFFSYPMESIHPEQINVKSRSLQKNVISNVAFNQHLNTQARQPSRHISKILYPANKKQEKSGSSHKTFWQMGGTSTSLKKIGHEYK